LALLAVSLLCFFTVAVKAKQFTDDVWKQLGLTPSDAHLNINYSFINGRLQYFGAKNAKDVALGNRVAVVNQLVAYAKKYVSSPEFKTAYQDFRLKMKPAEPAALPAVTAETIKAEEKQRLENQLKTAEANLNSSNPKIRNGAPTAIENIKKQITALDDPNNPVIKRKLDEAGRMSDAVLKQGDEAMKKFEATYPTDAKVLLKKRLQEMIDITADVDYTAELKEGYKGKKVFVNPTYEKKPAEWKLAFRAGKSATDAVRAAAQQWLKELN
jgi:hypothetical protein